MRRHYVDDFYQRKCTAIDKGRSLLDLGGNKSAKRGSFNIHDHTDNVTYLNYSPKYSPDIIGDAHNLPFSESSYDFIICSELFEHLNNPQQVLSECYRILKPGGQLLITVPFMFPIHPDPYDFGRYTDQFWESQLESLGFSNTTIEWQGGFWCVAVDMGRGLLMEKEAQYSGIKEKLVNWLFTNCQHWLKQRAVSWDSKRNADTFFMKGCTTGFGISTFKE